MITHRTPARVGLLGNPSDGYNGKVISFALQNFHAQVTVEPSDTIQIEPDLVEDGYIHKSLTSLVERVDSAGYLGGMQLLLATCRTFALHCESHAIDLSNKGLRLRYRSSIPRQCGLSGSSAIIISCLKCLIELFKLSDRVPKQEWPKLALDAEEQLGITAGLQDRVIQTFEGLLYMNFAEQYLESDGLPWIERLDPSSLPQLYLVYCQDPSSSGKMHSTVRQRYNQGDQDVHKMLAEFADLAELGRLAIKEGSEAGLAHLMDQNFACRRQLFGDTNLGAANLRMVQIVQLHGGSAKLTGSGGAVVAIFPESKITDWKQAIEKASRVCKQEGYTMVAVEVAIPDSS